MEFPKRSQPEILENWKVKNYEENVEASQLFQAGNKRHQ
jgi:hypothetical protein